jgi:hypothetical protein
VDEECDPETAREYWMLAIYETLKDRFDKGLIKV